MLPDERPFLRIPPFPGAKIHRFRSSATAVAGECLVDLVRELKVGGSYWSPQPRLPDRYVLVRAERAPSAVETFEYPIVLWTDESSSLHGPFLEVKGECDPWHMLAGATMFVTNVVDELSLIASIVGVPVQLFDPVTKTLTPSRLNPSALLANALYRSYENPFTGDPMSTREALELCGFWRCLIDNNRDIVGGFGFASWKQDNIAPLLWGGNGTFPFMTSARRVRPGAAVAVWRAKMSANQLASVQRKGASLIEVEDGFLRSQGLGANCVPPLSITVDRRGVYFDPRHPSDLEMILENGDFDEELIARARTLRKLVVEAKLAKYERSGAATLERPAGTRRHVLVPGQVEDDRSVQEGGGGLVSNLELLARTRAHAPDAFILYKPHPDVLAGHRRGQIPERLCLKHADEIVTDAGISSLIDMVDEVHVNTSLTGFEALLRGKPVTTHGVPFYAGWGLTHDLGPVPVRRSAKRTVDELIAAVLLIYPRYLDPVTRLPCPAEVVVTRLADRSAGCGGWLVRMRQFQGKLVSGLKGFLQ